MTVENFYHFAAVLIAAIELNSKIVLSEYSKTSLSKRLKWFWCIEDGDRHRWKQWFGESCVSKHQDGLLEAVVKGVSPALLVSGETFSRYQNQSSCLN